MAGELLWSAAHEVAAEACHAAIQAGSMLEALLALEAPSAEDAGWCRQRLSAWSAALGDLPPDPLGQAIALRRVLGELAGLRGDSADYHDPRNCDLTAVVGRRRGMPILLSAVWMIVGAGAGVVVEGVGLPGHFVARVGGQAGVIVDPFAGGQPLSESGCRQLVERITRGATSWDARWLAPTSVGALVERVVRNRVACAHRVGSRAMVYRNARLGALLGPDEPDAQLAYARAAELVGAHRQALELYQQVMLSFAGSHHAQVAEARRRALLSAPPTLH